MSRALLWKHGIIAVVVIASLAGVLCRVYGLASGYCAMKGKGIACPFADMSSGSGMTPAGKSASPAR